MIAPTPFQAKLPLERSLITLKEYEYLTPASEGQGALLRGLSFDSWPRARGLAVSLAEAGVATLTELREGLSIKAGSFIGRIALGPLDLAITPKIEWSRWLTLIGYALRLRGLHRSKGVRLPIATEALQDLVILQLVMEARDLIARGLHREYLRHRRPLAVPRGRIDFERIARRGGIREARIPCRFTRRSDDSPLNRALFAGLRAGALLARDKGLRADVHQLMHEMEPSVTPQWLSRVVLDEADRALDRRTLRYEPALQLIKLLHDGQAVSLGGQTDGSRVVLPGFALDMNPLWQRLLGRILGEWTRDIELREEYRLKGVFRKNAEYPPHRSSPMPRPDFAVFRKGALVTFLDAKYRDLWSKDLPRDMLYQLALYAVAQGNGVSAMLYPTDAKEAAEERLDLCDPVSGSTKASVALRPVGLSMLESLITTPTSTDRTKRRRLFANSLIGL